MSGKWNKYNIKSARPPDGRKGSEYYRLLLKVYGENEAIRLYHLFKYQLNQGSIKSYQLIYLNEYQTPHTYQ